MRRLCASCFKIESPYKSLKGDSMYDRDDSFGGELAGYKGWQDDFRTEIRKDIGGVR